MFYQYDARQEKCPLPLVKTRLLLKKMQCRDSCKVIIADKGSKIDIPKYLVKQGYQFTQQQLSDVLIELHITK
jgi:TusA-related sulfurtransferase